MRFTEDVPALSQRQTPTATDGPGGPSTAPAADAAGAPLQRRHCVLGALAGMGLGAGGLSGCGSTPGRAPAPSPTAPPGPATTAPGRAGKPAVPPGATARTWEEYQILAARRLVQANPTSSYMGVPPQPLLAIPVLEIELYVDGSIQSIKVQRQPSQARDTVQLAIDAVRRAAPFPPVGNLPKPWRFTEVFLFDDNRRFKPRSLD